MSTTVKNRLRAIPASVRAALLLVIAGASIMAAAQAASAIVTQEVRLDLPIALDGEVWAVEQVGNTVVVGGNFTRVQISRNGPIVNQAAIYAYDLDSGTLLQDFNPILIRNSGVAEVRDLQATPDGTGVYVGGRFTAVNDRTDNQVRVRNRIALFDLDGRLDRNFAQAGVDAAVLSLDLDRWNRLYVGGTFETAFDLAPGRPPIEQAVRGLARFNSTTGQFDAGFRYESREDIGRDIDGVRQLGVVKVVLHPNGNELFVAHRGAELVNTATGQVADSPGIARINIGATSHGAVPFKALFPDPADPIQDFYHAEQCGGRGLQIRDLDVANNYLVVVHQGADSGPQCDTAVRFSTAAGDKRPAWVSRAFDSIFSVEIDGPDVYIGGHFRFLVNSSAPSPYPGDSVANGEEPPEGNIYVADPNEDPNFRADLVDPGYVFPVGQIGVLSATTGFANPSFTPVSDANLGVLELTAIDRGLLLGQDQSRINGFNVGRSAFFDNNADAANPNCSVSINGSGSPVVSWDNIGSVNSWNVRVNDSFVSNQAGNVTQFVDDDAETGVTLNYALRYNRNGVTLTSDCGSVTRANQEAPTPTCTTALSNNQVTVNWNDEGWSRVAVRANDSFVASVDGGTSVFQETGSPGTTTYSIRAFINGERFDATCSPNVVIEVAGLTCSATLTGDQVTLQWNDGGWNRASVRRNGTFLAGVDGDVTTFSETAPTGTTTYAIRAFLNGDRFEEECTPDIVADAPTLGVLTCTETVVGGNVILEWNDVGANSYQVRTNGSWTETLAGGTTSYTTANNGDTVSIRYRLGGQQFNATCG